MSVHCSSIHINHTLQEKENWFSWRGEPFVLCLVGALAPVGPRSDPSNSLMPWNNPHTWERHGRGTDQPPCSAGNCLTYLKANVWFSNTEKWSTQELATEELLSEGPAGVMPAWVPFAGDWNGRSGRRQHGYTQSTFPDPQVDLFIQYLPHLKRTCEYSGLRREFIVWFIKAGF